MTQAEGRRDGEQQHVGPPSAEAHRHRTRTSTSTSNTAHLSLLQQQDAAPKPFSGSRVALVIRTARAGPTVSDTEPRVALFSQRLAELLPHRASTSSDFSQPSANGGRPDHLSRDRHWAPVNLRGQATDPAMALYTKFQERGLRRCKAVKGPSDSIQGSGLE